MRWVGARLAASAALSVALLACGGGSPAQTDGDGEADPGGEPEAETGEPAPDCAAIPFAPEPAAVDGLDAVPIDVDDLAATLRFDASAGSPGASASATLRFRLGPAGGMPFLDLRQTPASVELDGAPLAANQVARHDFGRGLDSGFVILAAELPPCSEHTLVLDYPLARPDAPAAKPITFLSDPDGVYFGFDLSDLEPGRYLESWLPAGMAWDRHPIHLRVELVGATDEHLLISNAATQTHSGADGLHAWELEFPPSTTALAPLVELLPASRVTRETGNFAVGGGVEVPYTIFVDTDVTTPTADIVAELAALLPEFVARFGPYPHPALTVHVRGGGRSMEYAGAMVSTVAALDHELVHAWWARGTSPARYADGWIDEGWATYQTNETDARTPLPLDPAAGPWRIYDAHPFARETPDVAYAGGRLVFAGLADLLGVAELDAAMAEIHAAHGPLASLTTAELERQLHCASGENPAVRQIFRRYVYGFDGDPEPLAPGACPP